MKTYDDLSYQSLVSALPELKALTGIENESTTRMRAIDTIVFDVLFWEKGSVEAEKYCRSEGYADYLFSLHGSPRLVLEAKRSGVSFVIENRHFEDRPYAFGLLSKECKSAMDAMQQAIGYAATLGARYVGITNGHQWLFCLTFVQGQPLEQRLIYAFESIEAISVRFRTFFNCFSKYGIENNAVSKDLLDTLKLPPPVKLSSQVPGYPVAAARNVFQNELSYILDYVWQLMSQDEGTIEFVENCYVNPSSHEDILALVREIILKRKIEDDVLRQYDVKTIDRLPHELAHLPAERPFVVLGEVGRGKSSFLKYLRFIAAKEHLNGYLQIDLNFIDRPDDASEIPTFVYGEVERQLREYYSIDIHEDRFVRGVLHGDLQRLKRTPKGILYIEDKDQYRHIEVAEIENLVQGRHTYLTKVIHHLKKGRNCSVAIFFDNLDRRVPEIQEQAFLKASAIARDWASLVFICLRPDTYYRSHSDGILDTIAPTAFTVGQPDLALVLKKRFGYAKAIAQGASVGPRLSSKVPSKNIAFDLPRVAQILDSCEFAAWKRHGIIPTLEAVSNGNIRRLLDFARTILSSGHLDTKKILDKIEKTGRYLIPDFEGVKTLLYGDYMHYDPDRSPFINLFDIRNSDASEHFLRLAILHYLSKIPMDGATKGYIQVSELIKYLSNLGYTFNVALDAIKLLVEGHLMRKPVGDDSDVTEGDRIRITSLGRYHVNSLVKLFQYVDAVIIDTPILEEDTRRNIHVEPDILGRLRMTQLFLEYLNHCANSIQDKELHDAWQQIYFDVLSNIDEIRQRVEANLSVRVTRKPGEPREWAR